MSRRGGGVSVANPSTNAASPSPSPSDASALAETDVHPDVWSMALQQDLEWRKADLVHVLYWLRQYLAICFGVLFGLLQLTGLPAMILFVLLTVGLTWIYMKSFLGVDDEDEMYGTRYDLLQEGMWNSFTLFLAIWIATYSLHF